MEGEGRERLAAAAWRERAEIYRGRAEVISAQGEWERVGPGLWRPWRDCQPFLSLLPLKPRPVLLRVSTSCPS